VLVAEEEDADGAAGHSLEYCGKLDNKWRCT
jgi:hypothetical protein